MNRQPQQSNNETDDLKIEEMLYLAGRRLSQSAAPPPRGVLQSLIQSADVTNPAGSRYNLRKEDGLMDRLRNSIGNHMRIFVSVTVAVALLIVVGGTSYYVKSAHRVISRQLQQPSESQIQQSDQAIDQSLSQIDYQMNGLNQDSQNVDQSVQ